MKRKTEIQKEQMFTSELLKKYKQPCATFIQEMNDYFNAHSDLDQVYRRI